MLVEDFPGGPVVENPLVNAEDMCLIPAWVDLTCHGASMTVVRHDY